MPRHLTNCYPLTHSGWRQTTIGFKSIDAAGNNRDCGMQDRIDVNEAMSLQHEIRDIVTSAALNHSRQALRGSSLNFNNFTNLGSQRQVLKSILNEKNMKYINIIHIAVLSPLVFYDRLNLKVFL
jgi:hypothetical protein